MEYSPMLLIVLWALTPSDCLPLGDQVNATEEVAKVKEMQGPSMTMQEEVIPGYFTFNDGQPFLVEKDPLTGSLNFNIKTTPVKSSQQFFKNPDEDYLYEDEAGYGKDNIDRKDGDIYGLKNFGQNDIKDNLKGQEDLHKFLNLPVHYSSHNKFPLISSSYANTKVQGHGSSSYSNHKPYSTTKSPSTPSSTSATQKQETTKLTSTTPRSTTTYRTTSTTTTRPTTPSTTTSAYDYEYIDYYDDKYDQESSEKPALNLIPSGQYPPSTYATSKPTTIVTSTTTTKTPSTTTTTPTTTRKPPTYFTEPTKPSIKPVTTTPKEKLAIVTSLPIDPKDEEPEIDKTPLSIKLSTTTNKIEFMSTKNIGIVDKVNSTFNSQLEDSASNVVNVAERPINNNGELEFGMRLPTSGPHRGPAINQSKLEPVGFGYGVPVSNGPVPGLRPPPYGYNGVPPFQPMGSVHPHPLPPKRPSVNVDYKPTYDGNYVKPPKLGNVYPTPPHGHVQPSPPYAHPTQPHGNAHPSSPHGNAHPTPPYGNAHPTPLHGNAHPTPPHGNAHPTPPHGNARPTPPHASAHPTPPHGNVQPNSPHGNAHPTPPHTYLTVGSNHPSFHYSPVMNKPPPPFFPEDQVHASSINHHSYDNVIKHKIPENMNIGDNFNIVVGNFPKYPPQQLNFSSLNHVENKKPTDQTPEFNGKPSYPTKIPHPSYENPNSQSGTQLGPLRPPVNFPDNSPKPSEGFSLVPDNQFVKVSQDQANPSYSLQTSFSIGAPQYEDEKEPSRPMQGIGQVLFPDDEKVVEGNKRPSPWPQGQPGPPSFNENPPPSFNGPPAAPHHQNSGRPPIPPQQRPPQRFPPEMHQAGGESYPRPPWESHMKHPYIYNPGQKKDPMSPPPGFLSPKRPKPPGPQRPDLPNILPQFRPNAKVGEYHGHPHSNHPPYINPPKVREPYDTLQPPPLPRPQFLRHHGVEEPLPEKKMDKKDQLPVHLPLVHKRMTGPQSGSRVTPLGMIQGNLPPRNAMLRTDLKEYEKKKDEPVFVVYPSNGANKASSGHSEGMVVVGTRGSQRPLPPDNLGMQDDLDPFALDDNNNFPISVRDRSDTPILKSKSTPKPHQKLEFPYTLVKPGVVESPQKIISSGTVDLKKEYTAYSPTISSSTEEILLKEHDSEINIIPYLQDYMPFATKKPLGKPVDGWNIEDKSTLKPLSVTLNTLLGSTNKPIKNHLMVTEKSDSEPERQDFQAPFHASLSEPSQGWSVVTQNTVTSDKTSVDQTTFKPTEPSKFDIENFKPELLSGFKPIIPPKFDDDRPTTKAA